MLGAPLLLCYDLNTSSSFGMVCSQRHLQYFRFSGEEFYPPPHCFARCALWKFLFLGGAVAQAVCLVGWPLIVLLTENEIFNCDCRLYDPEDPFQTSQFCQLVVEYSGIYCCIELWLK